MSRCVVGVPLTGLRDCFAGRSDVAGEEAAVGGQHEPPVWSGAQQGGAGDVFELPDLPGEAGGRGAELAACWRSGCPGIASGAWLLRL